MWTGRTSLICNAKVVPQGGSGRAAVIGICFQICSCISLGLPYLWQGFPGQKYVCRHHPDGLHMGWKCIPTSACLMYCACAMQLCMQRQSDGPSAHGIYTVICTVYKLPGESDIWHMYTVWDFWLLLDFLHPKIQHGSKKKDMSETTQTNREHSFLHIIYPKGDFVEVGRYLTCIYGLWHSQHEQKQCFVHPIKESV